MQQMNAKETSDCLFETLKDSVGECAESPRRAKDGIAPAFAGITPVKCQIPGLGFFPGGDGLWKKPNSGSPVSISQRTIMVVGSTFGCEAYFRDLLAKKPVPEENGNMGTWGSLPVPLIRHRNRCFFTNAYPGLLKSENNIDPELHPAELDSTYISQSQSFFCRQVETVRPRLILFLGKLPGFVLGEERLRRMGWWPFLSRKWGWLRAFRPIDEAGKAFVPETRWHGVQHDIGIALLLHPCNRRRNLDKRGLSHPGSDPECGFLDDVIKATHSGILTTQDTED
jgi:hypothetical protein